MVDLRQVVKWWPENQTEKSLLMVKTVRYSNGLPSHATLPFEYRTTILSGIQLFRIQTVTALLFTFWEHWTSSGFWVNAAASNKCRLSAPLSSSSRNISTKSSTFSVNSSSKIFFRFDELSEMDILKQEPYGWPRIGDRSKESLPGTRQFYLVLCPAIKLFSVIESQTWWMNSC